MEKAYIINGLPVSAFYTQENIDTLFYPLLEKLTALHKEKGRRILAFLAAPPGAGKSTLVTFLEELAEQRPDLTPIQGIGMDGFHRYQHVLDASTMEREGKRVSMADFKGAPETFDLDRLSSFIERLTKEETMTWPVYDRPSHNPMEDALCIHSDIILIEGNYLLLDLPGWKELRRYADYTIKIKASAEFLEGRLISRKIKSGTSRESAAAFVKRSDLYNVNTCLVHTGEADLTLTLNPDGSFLGEFL